MYWCKCSYMKTCWICHTFIIKFCHCTTHYQWYKCCAAYTMDLPINPLKILSKKCYMKVKPSSFMITSFHAKWHLSERNECRNSILMTCHYPCHFCWRSRTGQSKFPLWHNPVKSQKYCTCVSQIRVVIRYHYDISGLNVPQTSFLWGDQRWHSEMSTHYTNTKVGIDGKTWSQLKRITVVDFEMLA